MASALVAVAPESNLAQYLQEIRKFPLLSAQEELRLSRRWHDCEDVEAMHVLVTSHLRLVAKIAMGYRGYGLPVGELVSQGNLGMLQAAQKFDPDRGFRLSTYAAWWIRAAITEYILRSWSLVKMGTTATQRKLFFNLRRLKAQMEEIGESNLQPEQVAKIARTLHVPEEAVVSMDRRLAAPDHSLNAPVRQDSDGELQDSIVDTAEPHDDVVNDRLVMSERRAMLGNALQTLNDRERVILIARRLKESPTTLEELSQQYGISRERIRKIELRALMKLQQAMKVRIAERNMRSIALRQAA